MFDYIKKKMDEHIAESVYQDNDDNDDKVVVEYAHLFQELDELTVGGTDENVARKMVVDIPLDDDIELDTIEINIGDGRLTDIPMDAQVQESSTMGMKTFDDFYQEACTSVSVLPRESEDLHETRVMKYANKKYSEYKDLIVQEGLFGFDKISINDSSVPMYLTANFGPISPENPNQNYYVKLDVFFQVDKKDKLLKKQLESLNRATAYDVFANIAKFVEAEFRGKYQSEMKGKSLWDVCTPKKILVPWEPTDHFAVSVYFETEFLVDGKDSCSFTWTMPIKSNTKSSNIKELNNRDLTADMNKFISKKGYIKESFETKRPHRFDRFYQEAIDFGNEDQGDDAPPVNDDMNDDMPSVSAGADDGSDKTALPVDTNDVSDDIAKKVSDDNKPDEATENIPLDDDGLSGDEPTDPTTTDDTTTDDTSDVDDKLDDLNDMGNTDADLDTDIDSDLDVDNMTIDELLAQGSDKLKGMTIQQLKDFLGNSTPEQIQEAFLFSSNKNLNTELDVALRKALGILNDDNMEISELLTSFKKAGKDLNKVLSKACKATKIYSDDERVKFTKLNRCLVDLISTIKSQHDASYDSTIKRLIQAFTSESAIVSNIIESKKTGTDASKNDKGLKKNG